MKLQATATLLAIFLSWQGASAGPGGTDALDSGYMAMQKVFSHPDFSVSPTSCHVSSEIDYDNYLLDMAKFRGAWLYKDKSVEFYQRHGHQILTILATKEATLLTQALFGPQAKAKPTSCKFELLVSDQDRYGNPKPYVLASWQFTRALAERVNWNSLDDRRFPELAINYRYGHKFLALMAEEKSRGNGHTAQGPDAPKGRHATYMATAKGNCTRFVAYDTDVTGKCDGKLLNIVYDDGRSSFTFLGSNPLVVVTFSGPGQSEVHAGPNTAVETLDAVITTFDGKTHTIRAVGTCRFTNPDAGRAVVVCDVSSADGEFSGSFDYDGSSLEISR